jgi:hypothetical protein
MATVGARRRLVVTTDPTAGLLLIGGSLVFLIGAAVGVPRVFTERDAEVRLALLTERVGSWRAAQPLYGLGPLIAAAGVGLLAVDEPGGASRGAFGAGCVALLAGAASWGWSLYLRGTRIADFARGSLPAWPFATCASEISRRSCSPCSCYRSALRSSSSTRSRSPRR